MESRQYEKPQAEVVEFGQGDMGRVVTTSGDGTTAPPAGPGAPHITI